MGKHSFIILFILALLLDTVILSAQTTDNERGESESLVVLHSSRRASMYSAVIPGLGQVYNKKYWKIPIIYTGFGVMGYFIYFNASNYNEYKQALIDFTDGDINTYSYLNLIGPNVDPGRFDPRFGSPDYNPSDEAWFKEQLENNMNYYRRYRDLSVILTFAWYALNIIDATVDGYLFSYDMSEDLSLQLDPQLFYLPDHMNALGLKFRFSF